MTVTGVPTYGTGMPATMAMPSYPTMPMAAIAPAGHGGYAAMQNMGSCCGTPQANLAGGNPFHGASQFAYGPEMQGLSQHLSPQQLAALTSQAAPAPCSAMDSVNKCVLKYSALVLRMIGANELFGRIENNMFNTIGETAMTPGGVQTIVKTVPPPSSFLGRLFQRFRGQPNTIVEEIKIPLGANISKTLALAEELRYVNRFAKAAEAYQQSGLRGGFSAFMTRPASMGSGIWGQLRGSMQNFLLNNMLLKSYSMPPTSFATDGKLYAMKGGIANIAGRILPVMFGFSLLTAGVKGFCESSSQGEGPLMSMLGAIGGVGSEFAKMFVSYKTADLGFAAAQFLLPKLIPALVPGGLALRALSLIPMAIAGVTGYDITEKVLGFGKSVVGMIASSIFGLGR